jgi:hypothetical protein
MHLNAHIVSVCIYELTSFCSVFHTYNKFAVFKFVRSELTCAGVKFQVYSRVASWLFPTLSSCKRNKKKTWNSNFILTHFLAAVFPPHPAQPTSYTTTTTTRFFLNSAQSSVILRSLEQQCNPEDSASERDLFASFPSRVLKLNPLLDFLKISNILLKTLLRRVDIKLLSLMWYWFDKNSRVSSLSPWHCLGCGGRWHSAVLAFVAFCYNV